MTASNIAEAVCTGCGITYQKDHASKKYCPRTCSNKVNSKKSIANLKTLKLTLKVKHVCVNCDKEYEKPYGKCGLRKYCSAKCKQLYRSHYYKNAVAKGYYKTQQLTDEDEILKIIHRAYWRSEA